MRRWAPSSFVTMLTLLVLQGQILAAPKKESPKQPRGLDGTEIELGGTIHNLRTGGAGRYLIFRLKDSDKLIILDAAAGKMLKPITVPGDFQFAADRDSLFVILNGQRVVQRYNLESQAREKTVLLTDDRPVQLAAMGDAGTGPLAIWFGSKVTFLDAGSLKPLEVSGKALEVPGLDLWPSADGRTFAAYGWTTGQIQLMRLDHVTATSADCTITSSNAWVTHNMAWGFPGPDGSLLVRHDGDTGLFANGITPLDTTQFKGAWLYPTEDPRFLLALRRANPYNAKENSISIVASSNRQVLYTIRNMEPVTDGQIGTAIGRIGCEPRVRYLPEEKLLICIPESNDRVIVHPFDLEKALKSAGADYLYVISLPHTQLAPKAEFSYQIEALSNAGKLKYKLDEGPAGMAVSAEGKVTWTAPQEPDKDKVPVILTVTDASGTEATHAFELTLPGPKVKIVAAVPQTPTRETKPPETTTGIPPSPALVSDPAAIKAAGAKLVGDWEAIVVLDDAKLDAMLKQAGPGNQTPEAMARLKASLQGVKMTMTLRENGSGETVISGLGAPPEPQSCKWEVIAAPAPGRITRSMALKVKLTDKAGHCEETEARLLTPTQLRISLSDDRVYPLVNALRFRRTGPASPGRE